MVVKISVVSGATAKLMGKIKSNLTPNYHDIQRTSVSKKSHLATRACHEAGLKQMEPLEASTGLETTFLCIH